MVYTLTSDTTGGVTVVVDYSQDAFRGYGPARVRDTCTSGDDLEATRPTTIDYVATHLHGRTTPTPI